MYSSLYWNYQFVRDRKRYAHPLLPYYKYRIAVNFSLVKNGTYEDDKQLSCFRAIIVPDKGRGVENADQYKV